MAIGSGLLSRAKAAFGTHFTKPGPGVGGEVFDLRKDLNEELLPVAAIVVEEFTNPVGTAASTAALLAATATVAEEVTLASTDLLAAGLAQLALWPRQLVFTTAGSTAADAPASVTITGLDKDGAAQTETMNLAQTAAAATSTKYWSAVTSIVYPAADGTGATVAIGFAAAVLRKATATVASAVTVSGSALVQTDLANYPRALVFTTGGNTPGDAPATATITGTDVNGNAITETLNLAQTATTATSTKFYASVSSITFPAADGTAATVAISPSAAIGLSRKVRTRAGATALLKEIAAGSVVTNGTLTAAASALPNGSYTPNTAADGANDYCIFYEMDAR